MNFLALQNENAIKPLAWLNRINWGSFQCLETASRTSHSWKTIWVGSALTDSLTAWACYLKKEGATLHLHNWHIFPSGLWQGLAPDIMDMPGVGGGILGGIGLWLTARGWGLDNCWGGVLTPDMAAFHKCSLPSHSRGNVLQSKALRFCKEIQPVPPKGNQSWIFIGRTDVKAEIPVVWPPDGKKWLIRKDPDAQKDWRWEKKVTQRMRCLDASLTQRMWVWVNSGNWWWTGRPGMLQSTGSQGVRHDWATELNWTALWLLWFPHSQWHPLTAPLVLRENSTGASFYCELLQHGPTVFQILCWAWHWPHTAYKARRKKHT